MSTDLNALFSAMNRGDVFAITDQLFPRGPQQPMPGNPTLVERPSPCADLGTAEVSVSHDRFVATVRELLMNERFDDARSFVEDEHRAINGR